MRSEFHHNLTNNTSWREICDRVHDSHATYYYYRLFLGQPIPLRVEVI